MDTYFCYIRRDARPVAEMKILHAWSDAELGRQLARLMTDRPDARLELFEGDRLVTAIEPGGEVTTAARVQRAADALALAR
jgi:hypothetical protein